jgi:hypothetical protein
MNTTDLVGDKYIYRSKYTSHFVHVIKITRVIMNQY